MARKLRVEYTGAVHHAMSRPCLEGEAFRRELFERMTEHYGSERAEAKLALAAARAPRP